jgi:hypothetical protein
MQFFELINKQICGFLFDLSALAPPLVTEIFKPLRHKDTKYHQEF